MDRQYKAFISYRHLPLEMDVARKLHRRIERYTIPAPLRRNGEKHPGLVFRDQDELPISSNLSENIYEALDHSEFLIVICTPETGKSQWVLRDIDYFLEHHDRDHVLTVLAAGSPDLAFPDALTERRGEDGALLERIEPLAANIVSDSAAGRDRLLKTESLRILAALIGCPFDALYKREQRYRRRRAALALSLAGLVAAAFIGLLLNRNARIRAQLLETQSKESWALAALSESAYREGDYSGALRYALQALPSQEEDRPYVARAEYALSRELPVYEEGEFRYCSSFEQETNIRRIECSRDGEWVVTVDNYDMLRCFRGSTGEELWRRETLSGNRIFFPEEGGTVLLADADSIRLARCENGESLWEQPEMRLLTVAPDGNRFLAVSDRDELLILSTGTGERLSARVFETGVPDIMSCDISPDGKSVALLSYRYVGTEDAELQIWEPESDTLRTLDSFPDPNTLMEAYELRFTPEGDLLLGYERLEEEAFAARYDRGADWTRRYRTELTRETDLTYNRASSYAAGIKLLDCGGGKLAFLCRMNLFLLDAESGELSEHVLLPDFPLAARMYENGSMSLVLKNGVITACTVDGVLSYQFNLFYFQCEYELQGAVIRGEKHRDSCFALVPALHRNRVVLVKEVHNDALETLVPETKLLNSCRLYSSRSGRIQVALRFNSDSKVLEGCWLDLNGEDQIHELSIPLDRYLYFRQDQVSVTEDRKLIIEGRVFDLEKGSVSELNEPSGNWVSGETGEGRVLSALFDSGTAHDGDWTLLLYEDGRYLRETVYPEQPEKSGSRGCYVRGVGGSGFVLADVSGVYPPAEGELASYSVEEDRWYRLEGVGRLNYAYALGDKEAWFATPDGEGAVVLRDLRSGETVLPIPCATPAKAIVKLSFLSQDRLLLAFTSGGGLEIYDTATGELLHRSDYGELGMSFNDSSRYLCREIPGERLLIMVDNQYFTEALAIVIDESCWERVGAYPGPAGWLPWSGEVLVKHNLGDLYRTKLLDTRGLTDLAERILAGD